MRFCIMRPPRCLVFLALSMARLPAAPVETAPFDSSTAWALPGGEKGVLLEKGKAAAVLVRVPMLPDKEKDVGG